MSDTALRECTWYTAIAAVLLAAVVFPFYLGWIGVPVGPFVGYLVMAAALLFAADAVHNTGYYWSWRTYPVNFGLLLLSLSLPAFISFGIGAAFAPTRA